MKKTAAEIYSECGEAFTLIAIAGKQDVTVTAMVAWEAAMGGDMVVVPDEDALNKVLATGVSLIVVPVGLEGKCADVMDKTAVITSNNPNLAHALLKQKYGDYDYTITGWDKVHASAIIHKTAEIASDVLIGPGVVVSEGVKIGKGCNIMANVVIERNAVIGEHVRIHPSAIVGWGSIIGNHCLILSQAILGSEGYGYAQDQKFNHYRIPQTGNVILGERVTIGASNTIDRGTHGPTMIGNGTIMDNLCHVAHNVKIGENCAIIAGFLCAGSTTLGDRVVASGGTMIKDHLNICGDTIFVHRAGIIKDVTEPGTYAGSPILPMKDYVVSNAIYGDLGSIRRQLMELEDKLSPVMGKMN
ncbi:MAG: UDP-3-O-(3-hydroxymyristoyl)glucosamine N-acyltransferase [Flavobacteriales bacterium]|nr:UDP-3-O-(3-hydroxymyristoyl)glucosamine N-acyltransferase [Flavobacteriales bacterium]